MITRKPDRNSRSSFEPADNFAHSASPLRRILSLTKKEFRQFIRNIPLVAVVLFAVILDPWSASMLTFDLKEYRFAVLDLDKSTKSVEYIDKLQPPYFILHRSLESMDEVHRILTRGETGMVIIIPEGFAREITDRKTCDVQVVLDGTSANSATIALSYLAGITARYSEDIILKEWKLADASSVGIPYINNKTRVLFNENLNDAWFLTLSEFLSALTLISILLPAAATVYEKQTGTLEQLLVTPLRVHEIMIAKILPMSVIVLVASYLGIFTVIKGIVGIPMRGSLVYFTFVTIIFLFTTTGLGLLIATIANNLAETILLSMIVLIPITFLSGTWTPPEAMPEWMQMLINFSPLKYYLDICYGLFLRGVGFLETWPSLLAMAGLGMGIFVVGAIRFRKKYA